MTTYAQALAARGKDLVVIWDFPDQLTRFVNKRTGDLDTPDGWQVFDGAVPQGEGGSTIDLRTGRLTVGDTKFGVPDRRGTVTSWLVAHDDSLAQTRVIRREGLRGTAESEWPSTEWIMEDYSLDGPGGYTFTLTNVLALLSRGLFSDFDSEAFRITDLTWTGGTLNLEKAPDSFRDSGYALVVDNSSRNCHLVSYSGKGALSLTGVATAFGVDGGGANFQQHDTSVYHVWARRGDPIGVGLRMMFTDPDPTSIYAVQQLLGTPEIDEWPLSDWTAVEPGATSVVEETVDNRGVSCARVTSDGTDHAQLHQLLATITATAGAPGKNVLIEWYARTAATPGMTPKMELIRYSGGTPGVDDRYWDESLNEWSASPVENAQTATPVGSFERYQHWVLIDPTFSSSDTYRLRVWLEAAGPSLVVGQIASVHAVGPFTSRPQNRWDTGDGDGIGLPEAYTDLASIEELRLALYFGEPVFDGNGDKVGGTAVLFVEKEPIEDFKVFLEEHLLRPFANFPATDGRERLFFERYFKAPPDETSINDRWQHDRFRPAWRRDLLRRMNHLSLDSDWHPGESEFGIRRPIKQATSVARYTESKILAVECRGGRTGLYNFPDYQSQLDLQQSASLIFLETATPSGTIVVPCFYEFRNQGLASAVRLTLPGIPDLQTGEQSIDNAQFLVLSRRLRLSDGQVLLTVRQRRAPARGAFVAPDTVSASYNTASDADKEHCYIAPDDGGFDDGGLPYTVL